MKNFLNKNQNLLEIVWKSAVVMSHFKTPLWKINTQVKTVED